VVQSHGEYFATNDRLSIKYSATKKDIPPATSSELDFNVSTGTLRTLGIPTGGAIFAVGGLENVINWKFTRKMTRLQWEAIVGAPQQKVIVNGTETWTRMIKWNSKEQMAEFVLLENVAGT
jgi:hypothetical protein